MEYAVKANSFIKDVIIHQCPCKEIRKRGGGPGKYGQVYWQDFATLSEAEKYATEWQIRGHKKDYCGHCLKRLKA